MIKTLRITSIVAAILAGILFVFPVIFGVRSDEEAEQLLNSPGVVEQFKKARSSREKASASQSSPLVSQAKVFAGLINPPKPTAPVGKPGSRPVTQPRPITVSAKFPVLATCVYASNPERSVALINEPGKGARWVRQGSEVGHLIIEQVKEGLIVCRDGQKISEIPVEPRPTEMSLIEGPYSASTRESMQTRTMAATQSASQATVATVGKTSARITTGRPPVLRRPPQPQMSEAENAALEELGDRLQGLQRGLASGKTDSTQGPQDENLAAIMEELISDLKATRVSAEEAKKLGDLGEELKDVQQDPNRAQNGKIINRLRPPRSIPPRRQ